MFFHVIDGFVLTIRNRQARPVKYVVEKALLTLAGVVEQQLLEHLLVFIVTHMPFCLYDALWRVGTLTWEARR